MVDLERLIPLSLRSDSTATPLFCVHAGSGSAYPYLKLAQLLGADRAVYGIEAPGFDGGREPVRSLPELSAEYTETLREFQPDGAFLLLGWSFGGVIAFDMAQRLTAAGARVPQVVMIDVSLPQVTELPSEKEIVRRFLHEMLATTGAPQAALDRILAGHPDQASSEAIFLAVERSGAFPDLEADLLTERYAVFRAHVEASYGFELTTEPYNGPVVHLIASKSESQYMRWEKAATDLTEHILPGSHYSIWVGDSLLRLAELARAALARAS